jgi:hypothetical protein
LLARAKIVEILEIIDEYLEEHPDYEPGDLSKATNLIEEMYSRINDLFT